MKQNITKTSGVNGQVSKDTGLTIMQEKCAVLLASGVRITDVAKEVGTSRGTLYRWLSQVSFQCFYNLMKQDVKNYVDGKVLEMHSKALEGLSAGLESENEAVKLKASMWVIERIQQMPVGEISARQVLREKSQKMEDWGAEGRYNDALEKEGLGR